MRSRQAAPGLQQLGPARGIEVPWQSLLHCKEGARPEGGREQPAWRYLECSIHLSTSAGNQHEEKAAALRIRRKAGGRGSSPMEHCVAEGLRGGFFEKGTRVDNII